MANCNECKFINLTEDEQDRIEEKPNHMCMKHLVKLIHRNDHIGNCSYIYPCSKCDGDFEYINHLEREKNWKKEIKNDCNHCANGYIAGGELLCIGFMEPETCEENYSLNFLLQEEFNKDC